MGLSISTVLTQRPKSGEFFKNVGNEYEIDHRKYAVSPSQVAKDELYSSPEHFEEYQDEELKRHPITQAHYIAGNFLYYLIYYPFGQYKEFVHKRRHAWREKNGGFYYFHNRFRRVPTIDECDVSDLTCMFEADQQLVRDKLVETNIMSILRRRYLACSRKYNGETMQGPQKCLAEYLDFWLSKENYELKYGGIHVGLHTSSANMMKQKWLMLRERQLALQDDRLPDYECAT